MTPAIHSTSLVRAASDGKHRPASHPVLAGVPVAAPDHAKPLTGWRIRARRQVLGMSQYDLAARMGVSRPAVAQWESDAYRPTDEHMARLREVLSE